MSMLDSAKHFNISKTIVIRDGVILQLYSRARAPNRDYFGLTISNEDVILNIWNITHGPHVFPKKQKCPLGDLVIAKSLVSEIHRLFGAHVVEYCLALGRGDTRLECLPTKTFLKILRYLAGNDILKLGQTSRLFFELCNRNDVWGVIFTKRNKGKPSRDEVKAADEKGWKAVLRNKLVWSDGLNKKKNLKQSTTKSKTEACLSAAIASTLKKTEVAKEPVKLRQTVKTVKTVEKIAEIEAKSIFTTKNLNDLTDITKATKESFKTTPLPPKGILKKTGASAISKATTKLLNFAEKLDQIPLEKPPLMTTLEYKPMTTDKLQLTGCTTSGKTTRPSLNSILNDFISKDVKPPEFSAKDRHLNRFLENLDEKLGNNPYTLDSKLIETPSFNLKAGSVTKLTKSTKINKTPVNLPDKPKIVEFLTAKPVPNAKVAPTDKMTSKFEDYLATLKGKSVHPSVQISPRTSSTKGTKSDLLPKISELTRSINQIRSSFYNSDKLKIKIPTLNNTKVTNKNGCSQQLNNKLNNIVPTASSTSKLDMKKNVLRSQTKSATVKSSSSKIKNTNSTANINTNNQTVKPKTAPKMAAKSATHVNAKNK